MAAPKTKMGRIPCFCCGTPTMLKQNEAGTLTLSCDECDVSAFAKKGTAASRQWLSLVPSAEPTQAPTQAPARSRSETVPKEPGQGGEGRPNPAPAPKTSAWDFLGYGKAAGAK